MLKRIFSSLLPALVLAVSVSCSSSKPAQNAQSPAKKQTVAVATPFSVEKPKPPYRPAATLVHDLLNMRLDVRFNWEKQHVLGLATLTMKPYFYPQNEVVLDAKGFDIHSVALVKPKNQSLKYTYDNRYLRIQLDKSYSRNELFTVEIDYTAKPNELAAIAKENMAISADKGVYFINPLGTEPNKPRQIWTQGETHGASAWFPTFDQPNERMTQDLYITVEKNFKTLSNGTLVYARENADGTRTDYWKMEKPHAPYLVMMAIGEFAVVKDKWRNLEVSYWVEPEYEKTAKKIFGNTPEMLEYFSQKLGVDYPWEKYAQVVVRDFVSGAMENTSASTFMEALHLDERELLDENWDGIIAHELFHQWFGDLVTTENWANLTLQEGFADYSEYLWQEYKYGPDAAAFAQLEGHAQYMAEARYKQEPLIRYRHNQPDDMFDSHSYAKGGRVLHMLRHYVGDEAFWASLKQYLERHKYTAVEVDELRMAFEDTTGEDLKWFFDQWYLSPGHPQLTVAHRHEGGNLVVQVTQTQDSTRTPVYRLPVTIGWYTNGKLNTVPVTITKASQTFTLPVTAKPDLVLFDTERQLLADITHPKTDAELLYQLRNSNHLTFKAQAIQKLEDKTSNPEVRQAILAKFNEPYHMLRFLAIDAFREYKGEGKEAVIAALKNAAQTDKHRPVRAHAIEILASMKAPATEVYTQGLQDSSYAVIAASIDALASSKAPNLLAQIEKLENLNKGDIPFAVADYYAENNVPGKQPWFQQQVAKANGGTLYQLLQDYGKYLLKQDLATQQKAVPQLAKLAKEHPQFFIRLSAFQALNMLEETPEVKTLKQEIKAGEKDERLLKAYESM